MIVYTMLLLLLYAGCKGLAGNIWLKEYQFDITRRLPLSTVSSPQQYNLFHDVDARKNVVRAKLFVYSKPF